MSLRRQGKIAQAQGDFDKAKQFGYNGRKPGDTRMSYSNKPNFRKFGSV
jgi:hypothetical protein